MEPLSNLGQTHDVNRIRDDAGDGTGITIRPVQRPEIHRCLQLILGQGSRLATEEQVTDFLRFAVYRGINLNDIWLAADSTNKILWAVLPVPSPGRTMLLFTPTHVPPDILDTAICPLVERVLEHSQTRDIHLAQVLLDPTERHAIRLFEKCHFDRLAELVYLDREVRRAHDADLPAGCTWQTYSAATHNDFADTITQTYAGSLDCPTLNGRRNIEDVLAGHKSSGEFDPNLWFLLTTQSSDLSPQSSLGVLLLNRSTRTDSLELVYLGLTPEARGRGFGDAMMKHALAMTATIGSRRLTLAVDSKNQPALDLYHRHGLSRICSRVALLRDLRSNNRQSQIENRK